MTPTPPPDLFTLACDVAVGRAPAAEGAALPGEVVALARKVVALGRLVASTPRCPPAVLARAEALFRAPRATGPAVLWRLLFDSWGGLAPALRGAGRPRFLRWSGENGSLDVEVAPVEGGALHLRGTLDGPRADTSIAIEGEHGKPRHVELSPGGAFEATVPAATGAFSLAVRVGRRTVARTERIPRSAE